VFASAAASDAQSQSPFFPLSVLLAAVSLHVPREQFLLLENERQFNESLIAEREQGIREIEAAVVEVNQIFKDLAQITAEQSIIIGMGWRYVHVICLGCVVL
jgi:syntaxin 7